VIRENFPKEAKNKIRSFYKNFYELVKSFIDNVEKKGESKGHELEAEPFLVAKELKAMAAADSRKDITPHRKDSDVMMQEESK
jgi:hypothetical protein